MTKEMKPNDEVPLERQLRMAVDDFRAWVATHDSPPDATPRVRLMEVVSMARATFYGICDSGQVWTAGRRSPYWAWQQRRRVLWSMDGAAIVRLSNEFRAVSAALKQPLSSVSQSWWDNGDYSGLGLEVRGSGAVVEIFRLGPDGELDTWDPRPVDGLVDSGEPDEEPSELGSDEPEDAAPAESDDLDVNLVEDDEELETADANAVAGADAVSDVDAAADAATASGVVEAADVSEEDPIVDDEEFLPVGESAGDALRRMSDEARDAIPSSIEEASSVKQIAWICGAPVLALVPGLSLEAARKAALLRVSNWHHANPRKDGEGRIEEYRVRSVEGL